MNVKLFYDALKIVNKCFPKSKNITADEFLYFLLGYKGTNSESDKLLLTLEKPLSNCLTGKGSLRAALGNRYADIQSQAQNLHLKDMIKSCPRLDSKDSRNTEVRLLDMRNELLDLCKIYSLPCSASEKSEQLFSILFTACLTEVPLCLFASQRKQQLKPATLKETLGRSDDSKKLRQYLDQYHKIIISDQHGSGKSRFVQYCLSTWEISDYCCISYFTDLKSTKSNISFFKDKKHGASTSFEDLMDSSYSSSLLVIDHMNESDNFAEELDELASYAINVIVITTSRKPHNAFHMFSLSPLSDNDLINIFKNNSGLTLTDKEHELLLLDISQKNVLLISLIAGQCRQLARHTPDSSEILSALLSNLKDTLSNHLSLASNQPLTFKHPYNRKSLDLVGHIKSIYADFANKHKETDPLRRTMRFLCCFGYYAIPLSFLNLFSEYNSYTIDTLSDMGWLLKTDSIIQLPSLISRSVFAVEIPSGADCHELIDVMNSFLVNYDQTLNIPYLSNILFIFANSIYTKIKAKNNPRQKKASAEFENWQDLIYSIYNYYLENGNYQLAEEITRMIAYPNMSHKHSNLDPAFFQFSIHMSLQSWIKKIPKEADRLANSIKDDKTLLFANTTTFLIKTMDIAIYLYCNCFFTFYNNIDTGNTQKIDLEELKTYRFTLFNTIGKILHDIPNPKYDKSSKLSISQYEYYQLCHTLMESSEYISTYLFYPFLQGSNITSSDPSNLASQLCAETNTNYRIRSIAFAIFMRSLYRKDLQVNLHTSEYPIDSEMLILTIRCDINELHKQIIMCEHIPLHTVWICLYCYLQLITELSYLFQKSNQLLIPIYYSYILKSLLHRSTFSQEELKDAYEIITPYFSL